MNFKGIVTVAKQVKEMLIYLIEPLNSIKQTFTLAVYFMLKEVYLD